MIRDRFSGKLLLKWDLCVKGNVTAICNMSG